MKKDVFLHEIKKSRSITFEHNRYLLEYKPTILTDFKTEKRTRFRNIEDAYETAVIGERPLKELVDIAPTKNDLWYPKDENGEPELMIIDDSGIKIIPDEKVKEYWPEEDDDIDE